MSILNIFKGDAFSTIEMTAAVERTPFKPQGLGTLGIFEDKPIRTTALAVEERKGILTIIPTSERGTAPQPRNTEKRKMRYFEVPRLATDDTIFASELQGIREFGEETVLMQVQTEMARRVAGPTGLTSNIEYTWERHRLGAVQGILLDADGSTLYNWYDEFGVVQPDEIAFDLKGAGTAGTLRKRCADVSRTMQRASQGAWTPNTRVQALCGDTFWDDLVSHPDVVQTYTNWNAAVELRGGTAFQSMPFGDIDWINYRGSDDNSTIAIPTDKVKFFPKGAPGVFQRGLSPGESFQWINTLGKPTYIQMVFDKDRDQWVKAEAYSYPLHICTRPEMLLRGRRGA